MESDRLNLGPDTSSFGTIDVLDDLILDVRQNMFPTGVSLFADLRSDVHKEGAFLAVH
jgi:hypothetical protein